MLKEITVKNFLSFNDETTFTMEADVEKVSEYPGHIVKINDNNLLKVTSLYGPNGGGKSNLLKALVLPKNLVCKESFGMFETKCVFSNNDDIEETLFFVTDKFEIGYYFKSIIEQTDVDLSDNEHRFLRKMNVAKIINESVVYRKNGTNKFIELFSRNEKGIIEGKELSKIIKLTQLSKNKTVLAKIYEDYANNDYIKNELLLVCKELYEEINSIKNLDNTFDFGLHRSLLFNEKYLNEVDANKERLIKLLNSVDIKIKNIKIDYESNFPILFEREVLIENQIITKILPLQSESKGTQKIFYIFMSLLDSLDKNIIFYCDDMNSYLHPKLCRAIIELFNSENNKNCQFIFNSHDIINMTNEVFRRDEIWFAYRNENYSTVLVPLSNIVNSKNNQVRKDAKFNKQYLEGKYGADPFITKGLNWGE